MTSRWFLAPGREGEAEQALCELAASVDANEPGTLAYLVHRPCQGNTQIQSLPPTAPHSIVFFECYRDVDAFLAHLHGPLFQAFVRDHGGLFVTVAGKPYTTVEFLRRSAGFIRAAAGVDVHVTQGCRSPEALTSNRHPAVMFEFIARDQASLKSFYARVFGWQYTIGTGDFAYVHFPAGEPPLLGGIGQATETPGFARGHNFYLLVDDPAASLAAAIAAGGAELMSPIDIDGYRFAMFTDPEGNPVGLIAPFAR